MLVYILERQLRHVTIIARPAFLLNYPRAKMAEGLSHSKRDLEEDDVDLALKKAKLDGGMDLGGKK